MDTQQGFGVLIETIEYDEPLVGFYGDYDKLVDAFKEKCKETYENQDSMSNIYMKWADRVNPSWPCGMFHCQSYSYPDDDYKEMFDEWSSEEDSEEHNSSSEEESSDDE